MRSTQIVCILFVLVATSFLTAYSQINIKHDTSDVIYANACICGLSQEMLDKLQALLTPNPLTAPATGKDPQSPIAASGNDRGPPASNQGGNLLDTMAPTSSGGSGGESRGETTVSPQAGMTSAPGAPGAAGGSSANPDWLSLADQLQKIQAQIAAMQKPAIGGNGADWQQPPVAQSAGGKRDPEEKNDDQLQVGDLTDLVDGLDTDDSASKLNDGTRANSSTIESALQSTVPQMVSNLFSNIQNFVGANQADKSGANSSAPNVLVSIDGSSTNIKGNSADQMSSEGEKLFAQWIDHYLDTLHVTASTANHIRKSAIYLFNKILKQYVSSVSKMGGNLEANLQKSIQAALRDTQVFTSYLLKNYLNFSAGIMRIIGDQVSRIGKQLDNTGNKLANIDLNPFEIVSDVLDSLPNPSSLSKYFRRIGKFLTGESPDDDAANSSQATTTSSSNNGDSTTAQVPIVQTTQQQQVQQQPQQQQPIAANSPTSKPMVAIENTISNIGKSLFSWMG